MIFFQHGIQIQLQKKKVLAKKAWHYKIPHDLIYDPFIPCYSPIVEKLCKVIRIGYRRLFS